MNQFVFISFLAIFASIWSVQCTPTYYSKRVTSTSLGDGYTNTITETDDNGRKDVFRSRSLGEPEPLHFDHHIPDFRHRFISPPPFGSGSHSNDFGLNSINNDPIKLQMPEFDSKFPSFDELNSRFNRLDDPFERDSVPPQQQQIHSIPLSFPKFSDPIRDSLSFPTFPTLSEPIRDFQSNDIGSDQYSIHKKGFSSSINVDGHKQEKVGATTTINDNGRVSTYTLGDKPDVTPLGTNYFLN